MNDDVKKILGNFMWDLATVDEQGNPNVVPVAFKDVADDGTLEIGGVFLHTTRDNIEKNGRIAISAFDPKTWEGYQVKGTATVVTEGPVLEKFKAIADKALKGAATANCAVLVKPEHLIVSTPGKHNREELAL